MEFGEALAKAWADVRAVELPEALQELAFKEALKHYVGSNNGTPTSAPTPVTPPAAGNGPRTATTGAHLDVVAEETGVDLADLERVFYFDGTVPEFNVSARKLGRNKADRHRTVGLLMTVVRHYGLDETEISIDTIREVCVKLGFYDSSNFSTYMDSIPGVTLSGPRSKRVLRPRAEAKGKFKERINSIIGTAPAQDD